jgi:uncharacterized protein (TIGR02588 family)
MKDAASQPNTSSDSSKPSDSSKQSDSSKPSDPSDQSKPAEALAKRSPAEKITLAVASLILLTVVGLVIKVWLDPRSQLPPIITVSQTESIRTDKGQFYVHFEVVNVGGGTAESVQIIAELEIDGEVVESGEQQIDFLSGGETEEGAFIFSQDPQKGELSLRPASYKLP